MKEIEHPSTINLKARVWNAIDEFIYDNHGNPDTVMIHPETMYKALKEIATEGYISQLITQDGSKITIMGLKVLRSTDIEKNKIIVALTKPA